MKILKKRDITEEYLDHIICDICSSKIKLDAAGDTEHINIKKSFGYESEYFADNSNIDIDICEKCMYNFIQDKGLKHLIRNEYREGMEAWLRENQDI